MGRAQSGRAITYPTPPNLAGTLSPTVPPLCASAGIQPWGLALSPDGLSLYTFNNGNNTVGQYSLAAGVPSAMATSTVSAGGSGRAPRYGFVTPNNAWVICSHFGNSALGVHARNLTTGALGAVASKACSSGPFGVGMAVSADTTKYHVYVGHNTGSILSMFEMDPTTGAFTALSTATIAAGLAVQDVTVSPDGLHVYAANSGSATISQYSRDPATGLLTALSPATIATGSGPSKVIVSPDGAHVYASCNNAAALYQYSRNSSTGLLTALSPASVTGGINGPYGLAMTPSGDNLYMPSSDGNTILQVSRNSSSGLLTKLLPNAVQASSYATGVTSSLAGPYSMTVSSDGKYAYCTMAGSGTGTQAVVSFNIHP